MSLMVIKNKGGGVSGTPTQKLSQKGNIYLLYQNKLGGFRAVVSFINEIFVSISKKKKRREWKLVQKNDE